MANTKTQKEIKIAKTKSEDIFKFVVDKVKWQTLKDELNYSKATLFRYKTKLKEIHDRNGAFEALSEVFTIKEMNIIIDIFNDYIEHPEKYEKPRKKKEIDLDKQEDAIKNSMKDFQSGLMYKRSAEKTDESEDENQKQKAKNNNKAEVLDKHTDAVKKQRKAINKLPKDSPERAKKEAEFQHGKADRISEFWDSQKKDK